ncbi:uncharacterized protein LOC136041244 [Artemia franciscana]|uniref:uncharacterized protein LOC136041244 n=1 Tax=Artemia franciscana TaxID=6661 RepID=UPI0032DAD537
MNASTREYETRVASLPFGINFDPRMATELLTRLNTMEMFVPTHTTFMTPFQKDSLRYIWLELRKRDGAFGRFFDRLFSRFPQERECFERVHGFTEEQITKVVTSLQDIIDCTWNNDRDSVDRKIQDLAVHHAEMDVKKVNFERFATVLLEFMVEEMEEGISDFDLESWVVALKIFVNVMGVCLNQ